uniref:Uncharacterized protein n=1 Tax=Octopus bimaculoides TaxID=37653 RepID=A0A0L8I5A3_OCTBM
MQLSSLYTTDLHLLQSFADSYHFLSSIENSFRIVLLWAFNHSFGDPLFLLSSTWNTCLGIQWVGVIRSSESSGSKRGV